MKKVTVLVPAYNEELQINKTIAEISQHFTEEYEFRLLFVDDGSRDKTWAIIEEAASRYEFVEGIRFSRNFGKEAALIAGLSESDGDAVVVMDCDLQHPPRYIPEMLRLWDEGYEVVEGVKETRQNESFIKRKTADLFYGVFEKLSGLKLNNASDFKLLDRKVVDAIISMPEQVSFFRAQSAWVGFKRISLPFEVDDRQYGTSRWSMGQLLTLATHGIAAYSVKPLSFILYLGIIFFLAFIILGIYTIVATLSDSHISTLTAFITWQCFFNSVTLGSLALVGFYLSRTYEESKARPRYLITTKLVKRVHQDME